MYFDNQNVHQVESDSKLHDVMKKLANNNNDENDNSDDTYVIVVEQNDNTDENGSLVGKLRKETNVEMNEFIGILSPFNNAAMCRLCMSENVDDHFISIVGGTKLRFIDTTIKSALESLIDINVSGDDDLPKNVCGYCLSKLESAWAFQQQCLQSNRIMNKFKLASQQFCELGNNASQFGHLEEKIDSDMDNITHHCSEDDDLKKVTFVKEGKMCMKNRLKYRKIQKPKILRSLHDGQSSRKQTGASREDNQETTRTQTGHLLKKRHCCDMCGKLASSMAEINEHKVKSHSKSYPYSCTICNRFFKNEANLSHHVKKLHYISTDFTRTIRCTICNKKVNRNLVSDHYLSHKKELDRTH